MSVASKNLFALLDEDVPETTSAPPSKQDSSPAQAPSGNNRSQTQQRGRGPASRGGRYYQRGGKSTNAPTDAAPSGENAEENGNSEPRKRRDGDQRGRGRGGRGGRGSRGRGGGRGREFDRHSGTLPDSEKRVHQAWGGDDGERELQNEQAAVVDANVEAGVTAPADWTGETTTAAADWAETGANEQQADDWGATPASVNPAPAAETKETGGDSRHRRNQEDEEEDNTVTLDQYLAQKKQASADLPKLEGIRKANEGSDESLWKTAVHNGKGDGKGDDEENYFVGKTKSAPKARGKKTEKEFIEIEARFERPARGGRGGRGRGSDDRRGRGRGSGRNTNRSAGNAGVDVADETAFPSLS